VNQFTAKCVLKRFIRYIGDRLSNDENWANRFKSGDDNALNELLEIACKDLKVTVDEYLDIYQCNAELRTLQKKMINDIILGRSGGIGLESSAL
jgi:hypothetical protein